MAVYALVSASLIQASQSGGYDPIKPTWVYEAERGAIN
jgi:hypothetical protein